MLEGGLAVAEGTARDAMASLGKGAALQEEEFGTFRDPPAWWYPVRRSLAAAHLKAGDYMKAESEALASLKTWKHDPPARWVLGPVHAGHGRDDADAATPARARSRCPAADPPITAELI